MVANQQDPLSTAVSDQKLDLEADADSHPSHSLHHGAGEKEGQSEDAAAYPHAPAGPTLPADLPGKNAGTARPDETHFLQQSGITRVEAFNRVFGRTSLVAWLLYASLALTSMAYVFDQSSTFKYDTFATSYFDAASYIGTIGTVQSIISAYCAPSRHFLFESLVFAKT